LLPAKQSAYRRFHSTETAVLVVYNHIVCAVDSGQLVPLVLLDLSSAFDTVDHDCLLTILRNRFTVEGRAMDWFQSYLSERTQTFTAADSHSNSIAVNCSVPQGSVLGPIQFISYTEDVAELFNRHSVDFHLFADDTQLYTCAAPGREAIARQKLSTCIDDLVTGRISSAETQRVENGAYLVRQSYSTQQNGNQSVCDRRFRGRAAHRHCP